MTTIAWDGKVLAGDSLGVGGFIYDNGTKLCKYNGSLYGFGGSRQNMEIFKLWLGKGEVPDDRPSFDDESFQALKITSDGQCYVLDCKCVPFKVSTPHATGTGEGYAMGAMLAGKNAVEAVEIASKLDIYSGGEITALAPLISRNSVTG